MSLLTGVCISSLNSNTFWMSLTVFGLFFMATVFVIRQSEILIKSNNQKFHYRSLEMNTTHVRRRRQTLATKEPPTPTKACMEGKRGGGSLVLINDHCSVNKIHKFCGKYTWSSLKCDSVSKKNAPSIGSGIQAYKK